MSDSPIKCPMFELTDRPIEPKPFVNNIIYNCTHCKHWDHRKETVSWGSKCTKTDEIAEWVEEHSPWYRLPIKSEE